MLFRQAQAYEIPGLFKEGYKEWSKKRTFRQYCIDNGKEDAFGTRYVIEVQGEIVSSAILLKLADIGGRHAYGIGSVLTPRPHAGRGYATELLKRMIERAETGSYIFLFSDINPGFYTRFGFRELPQELQKAGQSVCMVLCDDDAWRSLTEGKARAIPDYF